MSAKTSFRLGQDAECFLQDKNGKLLSVIGKIGANKWNPQQVPNLPEGFTLQEDNVALEFGIPPAASADEFVRSTRLAMKAGLSKLKGHRFSNLSCAVFPEDQMQAPEAWVFGCEPDFNAWTGQENEKPQPPHKFMRSAGGHVHVETDKDRRHVIRAMDLCLGVPSVLMDPHPARRQLYGKAGAYRAKSYGAEYRTLSNFWIFQKHLTKWVWTSTEQALKFADQPEMLEEFGPQIQAAINDGDKQLANQLCKSFNLELV